jgi:hypothetical protein
MEGPSSGVYVTVKKNGVAIHSTLTDIYTYIFFSFLLYSFSHFFAFSFPFTAHNLSLIAYRSLTAARAGINCPAPRASIGSWRSNTSTNRFSARIKRTTEKNLRQ